MAVFPYITMTSQQQQELLRDVAIGLDWAKGLVSIHDVEARIGKPDRVSNQDDFIEYRYFPKKLMAMTFRFKKIDAINESAQVETFSISVNDDVHTNVPYSWFDDLKIKRLKRGDRLDDIRIETSDFFSPDGVIDTSSSLPENYVSFAWRMPIQEGSQYDIRVGASYLGEWINPGAAKVIENFRNATDLRKVVISRFYFQQEEIKQRNEARREKYGYMNLCTGMVCPESGLWEGWTKDGPMDVLRLSKGDKFDKVKTVPVYKSHQYCPMVDGQWMWLCPPQEIAGFTWHGITFKG